MESNKSTKETDLLELKYLSRTKAAAYLSVGIETFMALGIEYSVVGKRLFRWDIEDINSYMTSKKTYPSLRNSVCPNQKKGNKKCEYTKENVHQTGGRLGLCQ